MADEYVTSGEFGRWRTDFAAYQTREADHLESMERRIVAHIDARVDGIDQRLDELNGRTRKNSEAIIALDSQVEAIATHGCGQLAVHRQTLAEMEDRRPPLHRDRRAYGSAGLGAAVVALLYAAASWLQHLSARLP